MHTDFQYYLMVWFHRKNFRHSLKVMVIKKTREWRDTLILLNFNNSGALDCE